MTTGGASWARMIGDQVSKNAWARIGAVARICNRKRKNHYGEKGGWGAIGDPVWTDG